MTSKKAIYSSNKGIIFQEDVENALKKAGLEKGDTVMVHSDLQIFGKLADIRNKQEFLESILTAFLNVLGKEGTLIVPVFTYSFCNKEIFDVKNTSSSVGSFSEFVRKQKNAVRSIHPIFSCAGIGKNAKKLLTKLSKNSFGKDSFFDRLYKMNGKIMLFGRPFDITYLHYIEHAHGIKYRFIKQFSGIIIDSEGNRSEETYDYFVRYLDKGVEYKMENLGDEMDKKGLLKKAELGNSSILLLKAQDAYKVGWEMLDKNEYAFLAKKPSIKMKDKKGRAKKENNKSKSEPMMKIINDTWFIERNIVSDGYDKAAYYLRDLLNKLKKSAKNKSKVNIKIHEIPTGTKCWTWVVPEKWGVKEAWIKDDKGKKLLDKKDHPLHVLSYSLLVNKTVTKDELLKHLYTKPERPNAIPYEFKYYERDWGFCIQHNKLKNFTSNKYQVFIDSSFEKGTLKVVDTTIKGESDEIIALSAHLCHPCLVNDDLASVAIGVEIIKALMNQKNHYTYKILFQPETIGSLAYLSQNEDVIPKIKYGIFLEMLGNDNIHALQLSRQGNTYIDRMARYVMKRKLKKFNEGAFRRIIGNDEMVFNGPGVNIPMISLSRWPYPEYHTSDDNPSIVTEARLKESAELVLEILRIMDSNYFPKRTFKGPVFLSGYGLWVDWRVNKKLNANLEQIFLRFEGDKTIFDIAEDLDLDFNDALEYVNKFHDKGLITKEYHQK